MHVKVFDDGRIEAEIEYPPDYSVAHLNQKHSRSAHNELREIFKVVRIPHKSKFFPPMTCLRPKIIPAVNPSHAKAIVGVVVGVALIVGALYVLTKQGTKA